VAVLAGCGSGTIRPADDTGAVAPAPSVAPSAPVVDADPAPPPSPAPEAPTAPPDTTLAADTGAAAASQPGTVVEIRRVGRWVSSGIKGARRLVIRDPGTWAHFWSELGAGVRPEVDFSQDRAGRSAPADYVSLQGQDGALTCHSGMKRTLPREGPAGRITADK